MADHISKDAKLQATTSILNSYIKTFESKESPAGRAITLDEICQGFKQVYNTIDDTLPNEARKVGLG